MADRTFALDASHTVPAAGSTLTYTVDDGAGAAPDWIIKGMVFAIGETNASTNEPETAIVRVESAPVAGSTETQFTGRTISAATGSTTAVVDGQKCTVIGSAFEEGSGSPDSWSRELENGTGYCQIFKTACELTNTARATVYRGYASEWDRIWNLKLREHKVDIERAMLFGNAASQSGITIPMVLLVTLSKTHNLRLLELVLKYLTLKIKVILQLVQMLKQLTMLS